MKKTLFLFFITALLFSACAPLQDSELSQNREKWRTANISHYRFELSVGCFCPFGQQMPLTIEVQNGQVVSMAYNDGSIVPENERKSFEQYETIDALFDYTASVIGKADEIKINYNPTYGFPSNVQIDFIKNALDDELWLSVQSFEPLP